MAVVRLFIDCLGLAWYTDTHNHLPASALLWIVVRWIMCVSSDNRLPQFHPCGLKLPSLKSTVFPPFQNVLSHILSLTKLLHKNVLQYQELHCQEIFHCESNKTNLMLQILVYFFCKFDPKLKEFDLEQN